MKRGFLKTNKAKNALEKECRLEPDRSPPGGMKMAAPKQEPELVPTKSQSAEDKQKRYIVARPFFQSSAYIRYPISSHIPSSKKQPSAHLELGYYDIMPSTDLHRLPPCIASKYKDKRNEMN